MCDCREAGVCLGLRWLLPGRAGTAASPETRRNAPLAARELAGATSDSCHQAPAPRAGAILGRVADDETDEPTGVPLSWGGAAGNYTEGDARFSRALIVHEGKPNQIRWLVRSAELMPYHAETLSQPMRTLRRQLWAGRGGSVRSRKRSVRARACRPPAAAEGTERPMQVRIAQNGRKLALAPSPHVHAPPKKNTRAGAASRQVRKPASIVRAAEQRNNGTSWRCRR